MVDADAQITIQGITIGPKALDISSGSVSNSFKAKLRNSNVSSSEMDSIGLRTQHFSSKSMAILTKRRPDDVVTGGGTRMKVYDEPERRPCTELERGRG